MHISINKRYFLTAAAAIFVMLFSAVGMAGLMGWIPANQASSQNGMVSGYALPVSPDQPTVVDAVKPKVASAMTAPVATSSNNAVPRRDEAAKPVKPISRQMAPAGKKSTTMQPDAVKTIRACLDCAEVVAIHEVEQKGESNGLGAVAGGVVGGLVGNQIGKGKGNVLMTVVGVGGGAFAGNEIQKKINSKKVYVVKLRTDDGQFHTLTEPTAPGYAVGDQVKLHNGKVSTV